MKDSFDLKCLVLAGLLVAGTGWAVTPQADEFGLPDQAVGLLLDRPQQTVYPHLELLYEDASEGITRGKSWRGTPFQIGDKTYTHGLAFNSTKHLLVVLGRPAERFTAEVGLENNDSTQAGAVKGNGSVTFHILIDGKEVFTSPVLWLPYHGTGTVFTRNAPYYGSGRTPVEPYAFWSNAGQSTGFGIDVRLRDLDYAAIRRLLSQWRQVAPDYYGDFYPLTPWTRDDTAWMAWQFDRPEAGRGMVQVFRRHNSFYESARFSLRGLDAGAT